MGLIKICFSFMAGTVFGVYLAQNYNVPSIKTIPSTAVMMAKHFKEKYLKPKKRDDDD